MNLIKKHFLAAIIVVSMISYWISCSTATDKNAIDFESFKIERKEINHFTEIAKLTKAVKLETNKNCLVKTVTLVIHDPDNGDLLVKEFEGSKKIFRFDQQGKFLFSYGRHGQGPGEIASSVRSFALMPNGDLVLITFYKLIKFAKDGTFLNETRLSVTPNDIAVSDNEIYLSVISYNKTPAEKTALVKFNSELMQVSSVSGPYDTRLEKYKFLIIKNLTTQNGKVISSDFYDLKLRIYDTATKRYRHLTIPNKNRELDSVWSRKNFTEKDRKNIRMSIRRFDLLFASKNNIFLHEICIGKNIFNVWLLNLEKRKALVFPYYKLGRKWKLKEQSDLFIDRVAGSTKSEFIGVIEEAKEFEKFKHRYPVLKDITLNFEDNPVLVFIEFN